jgi:cytochrome d ubiquinol oxidase subunit II
MSTINWLFEINFAIFSIFFVLFVSELMGGVLLLVAYDATKAKVLPYLVPIWEVTGTFAAFWVVTGDFAYPSMLWPLANILAGLILVFLILFVLRNASITFAELLLKGGRISEKRLYQLFGLATLGIAVAVLVVLSAVVSGAGVDLANLSFSLWGWVTNPGSLPYLLGVVFIAVGLAPVFYDIAPLRRLSVPFTVAGVAVEAGALYLYSASFLSGYFLIPAVLTVLASVMYQFRATAALVTNKLVFAIVGTVIVFSLSYLVYPTAFGGAIAVDDVTTKGPMVGAFYVLSAVGAVVVGLLMAFYMVTVRHASRTPGVPASAAPVGPAAHNP